MMKIMLIGLLFMFLLMPLAVAGDEPVLFSSYVDSKGNIALPSDFRSSWVHLGTWVVTSQTAVGPRISETSPGTGLHNVYTQPESLKEYKKAGKWPDGTVIIMEIRTIKWDDTPTGHVIYGDETTSWFVMIKDSKGRFENNPNWGDGWGWALFKRNDPKKNISTNCKNDCVGCHEAVRSSDWVFIHGYPALK